jgi:hypothetical protein
MERPTALGPYEAWSWFGSPRDQVLNLVMDDNDREGQIQGLFQLANERAWG